MINEQKLNDFKSFLETTSLERADKDNFLFLAEYLSGKHAPKLASRSFLIHGEPGVGKTFIVEKFLNTLDTPIIFAGYAPVSHPRLIHCQNLSEILQQMERHKQSIIFMDDLGYIFDKDDCGEVKSDDKREFLEILDKIKAGNSVLIATLNAFGCMDWPMQDRIEVKLSVELPTEENRMMFFKSQFADCLDKKLMAFLTRSTYGYNYRDLPEIVRMSYRMGNGKITSRAVKSALETYTPTGFTEYKLIRNTGINFSHVVGKENEKNTLTRMVRIMKNRSLAKRLGISRPNFIIFQGPPGTGKTYMAKAFSGEISWPLINISAESVFRLRGAISSLHEIMSIGRRFRNCIIFIDEAEKLFAREFIGEDTPLQGALQSELDGVDAPIGSMVILAMNNLERFGEPIKDRFNILEFEFPNSQERYEFLSAKMKKARYLRFGSGLDGLVSMTENMSFRAIEKAWNEAAFQFMDSKKPITEEQFSTCIKRVSGISSAFNRHNPMFG